MNFISVVSSLLIASATLIIFTEVVTSDCTDPDEISSQSLPGGIEKTSQYSSEVRQAAKILQQKINALSPPTCQVRVEQILNGSTQVVAGTLVRLGMELCPQGGGCDTKECEICSAKVFQDLSGGFDVECFMCDGAK